MSIDGFGIELSLVSYLTKNLKETKLLESEIHVESLFYVDFPFKTDKHSL